MPTASIGAIAEFLTHGYWAAEGPRRFADSAITFNVIGLEPERATLARKAFEAWADVASLEFREVIGAAQIMVDDEGQGAHAASTVVNGIISQSRINVAKDWFGGSDEINSYTYQTFIHEIGHALGLGHAGPYNGAAPPYKAGDATWQESLMSYHSQKNGASYAYAVTPMPADIEAMQRVYGASNETAGDTIHRPTLAAAMTIYDAGGNDTLDLSAYSQDQTVDLRPGAYSDVGGLKGNLAIVGTIETVIGGSGDDHFIVPSSGSFFIVG